MWVNVHYKPENIHNALIYFLRKINFWVSYDFETSRKLIFLNSRIISFKYEKYIKRNFPIHVLDSCCLKNILICKIDEICLSTESFILNSKIFDYILLCAICNAIKGKGLYRNKRIFLPPPLRDPRGRGQNLNCKLKTFGFLDTLKV